MEKRPGFEKVVVAICFLIMLQGCSGGGGSSAPDVTPGPAPANANATAPDPIASPLPVNTYASASIAVATITAVNIGSPPVVDFTLVDEQGLALTGLAASNVRFTIAKLIPPANGGSAAWQSYINRMKTPTAVPENTPAIQATSESGGTLVDNEDGTYRYTFISDVTNITTPIAVEYEPTLTHRIAMQFSGGPVTNPVFDWIPATGQEAGVFSNNVVATQSCNSCHDPLALHGGGRQEVGYCVTCHNPGTSEPNSQSDMDFKVLIHKIHRGTNLPSVQAGGSYQVYGFRDSLHDYSEVNYPQDIRNCTKCHAGSATSSVTGTNVLTSEGDNWTEVPTQSACGSCHDDVDFAMHFGGQTDDSGCLSCHSVTGDPGSVANSHRDRIREAMAEFSVNLLSVQDTGVGNFPRVTFSVTNPLLNNQPYDLANDAAWAGARLAMGLALDTDDYTNTGLGSGLPSYAQTNALSNAIANGDGTYTLTSTTAIPDGTNPPGRTASGSGMVTMEGRGKKDVGEPGSPDIQNIPFTQPHLYFSIDEDDGNAVPRREVVSIDNCNSCHSVKVNHGNNRTNNIQACVGCHNPRNTDAAVRAIAGTPPSDGKVEQSIDFKVLIHGLHASAYRENPIQVVGFGGFSTHVFDEEEVQYPGRLENCKTCHQGNSYRLPLESGVLATTIESGSDPVDPGDDIMVTAASSACSSCHDSSIAQAHMEQNGGDFSATEASIASGISTETCQVCHGPQRQADVDAVHRLE